MLHRSSHSTFSLLHRTGMLSAVLVTAIGLGAPPVASQEAHDQNAHSHPAAHSGHAESGHEGVGTAAPIGRTGSAAFAAIQEVVTELNARDDTDWSRIDLEALRQHLADMERFTLKAEVVEREEIDGGLQVTVRGPDVETHRSLRNALRSHAPMLEQEMGWTVSVTDGEDRIVMEATDDTPQEAVRIRGLGYIGLMVTGSHHRKHHWQIATGRQPHGH